MNSISGPLYTRFLDSLSMQLIERIEEFLDPTFWELLSQDEKMKLQRLVYRKAEQQILHSMKEGEEIAKELESLFSLLNHLEPPKASALCKQAKVLAQLSVLKKNSPVLLLSLELVERAFREDPAFFYSTFHGWQEWGKILFFLNLYVQEDILLEKALEKFQEGEKIIKSQQPALEENLHDFYWDWAQAWMRLAKSSGEFGDYQKGVEKYARAYSFGCDLPHFLIDYAEALKMMGRVKGDANLFHEASSLLRKSITLCYLPEGESLRDSEALKRSWVLLTQVMKEIAEISGAEEDLQAADALFQEALTAVPQQAELWLAWADLYITQAWIHKSLTHVDTALEKLTSSKIQECNPLMISALLGEALSLLGLFLEDLKFLKEGETRIKEALQVAPDFLPLLYAAGISELCQGLYFTDDQRLTKGIEKLQKAIHADPTSPKLFVALFQTYLVWGVIQHNPWVIQKGIRVAARLVELRPFSPHFWGSWGVALMRLHHLEKEQIALIEEAIDKFQKAITLKPENPDPDWLFYLGCAYDLMGDHYGEETYYEKAIQYHHQVLDKAPQAINVRYHLALALAHLGEHLGHPETLYQACDLFQAIVKPDEEDDSVWNEWGYALLTLSQLIADPLNHSEETRLKNQAESTLMRAVELGNGPSLYDLACLYSLSHLQELSLEFLRKAEKRGELPPFEQLESEEWLDEVRQTVAFQEFLIDKKK